MKQTLMTFLNEGQNKRCGLVDSLRGIVSIFHFCKEFNIKFEIKFTYPFSLLTYLRSNEYDWTPTEDYSTEDIDKSVVEIFCKRESGQAEKHRTILHNLAETRRGQHIYIYTNTICFDSNFSLEFNELFAPTHHLSHLIESNIQLLSQKFNSASCRTCGVFGDFKDMLSPLSPENQLALIDKYKKAIGKLAEESSREGKKLFVTSDSRKLISELSGLDNIVIISGPLVHSRSSFDKEGIDKVFTDFFLISKAINVYSITSDGLYSGAFARYAAKLGNCKFSTINLSDYV